MEYTPMKALWLSTLLIIAFVFSCANPLKNKPPYWYNGYVYGTRGHELFCEGKIATALLFYRRALSQAKEHDIPEQVALYDFNIGRSFYELGKYDSATTCFCESYRYFSLSQNQSEARQAAGYAALSLCAIQKHDSAFVWYNKGVITPKKTEDKTFWLMVHGYLVWGRDHSKEALAYFNEANELYVKQHAWHGAAQMCFAQSRVYAYFGDYDEACRLISLALTYGDKTPLRFDRFRMLVAAVSMNSCNGDRVKAEWFFDRARQCVPDSMHLPGFDGLVSCNKNLFY